MFLFLALLLCNFCCASYLGNLFMCVFCHAFCMELTLSFFLGLEIVIAPFLTCSHFAESIISLFLLMLNVLFDIKNVGDFATELDDVFFSQSSLPPLSRYLSLANGSGFLATIFLAISRFAKNIGVVA